MAEREGRLWGPTQVLEIRHQEVRDSLDITPSPVRRLFKNTLNPVTDDEAKFHEGDNIAS